MTKSILSGDALRKQFEPKEFNSSCVMCSRELLERVVTYTERTLRESGGSWAGASLAELTCTMTDGSIRKLYIQCTWGGDQVDCQLLDTNPDNNDLKRFADQVKATGMAHGRLEDLQAAVDAGYLSEGEAMNLDD